MDIVNHYINKYEDVKKEWLITFVTFMRENFPNIKETISLQMPTYKFNKQFITFSITKDYFSFSTLDLEVIEELKGLLPKAKFGKGCAKVKYSDKEAIPIFFDACRKIVDRSKTNLR